MRLIAMLLLACVAIVARAEPLSSADPTGEPRTLELTSKRHAFEALGGAWVLSQAPSCNDTGSPSPPAAALFKPLGKTSLALDAGEACRWLWLRVHNTEATPASWVAHFTWPHIDVIELFSPSPSSSGPAAISGRAIAPGKRTLVSREPAIPVQLQAGETRDLYFLIKTSGYSGGTQLRLVEAHAYAQRQDIESYRHGAFVGLLATLLLVNALFFIGIHPTGYPYLLIYIAALGIDTLIWEGSVYQLPGVWRATALADHLQVATYAIAVISALGFGRVFLQVARQAPSADKVLRWSIVLQAMAIAISAIDMDLGLAIIDASFALAAPLLLGLAVWRAWAGDRSAIVLAISWFLQYLSFVLEVLMPSGADAGALAFEYAYFDLGLALANLLLGIGLIAFSFTLAFAFNQSRRETEVAQARAMRHLQETNLLKDSYGRELEHEVKARTEELERKNAQLEHQAGKLRAAHAAKVRFFDNASHEFRTPITLLQGPLSQVRERVRALGEDELDASLAVAARNAERLSNLVDKVLAISRLDAGSMPLRTRRADLAAFLRRTVSNFDSLAQDHDLALHIQTPPEQWLYFDAEKLETALFNLLSNAIKFTPRGGTICLSLLDSDEDDDEATAEPMVAIEVSDTGRGIPEAEQPRIFKRFMQTRYEDQQSTNGSSSGLGLALARELIVLHGGDLSVESELGLGSCFRIVLPKGRLHLRDEEVLDETPPTITELEQPAERSDRPLALVVEDNADMREFVAECLSPSFAVVPAADGLQGLARARETRPDLVVTDLVMPGMDGLTLLKALRADEPLRAVPVILLTARGTEAARLAGLAAGADDYLVKPFSAAELLARSRNLLARNSSAAEAARTLAHDSREPTRDEAFRQHAEQQVRQHLGDEKFDIAALADELHMSEATLRRKFQRLLGATPAEFMRRRKLEHARQLLASRQVETITEAAHSVGFRNANYFSRLYRQAFGESPAATQRVGASNQD